jgi:hypothetical protein
MQTAPGADRLLAIVRGNQHSARTGIPPSASIRRYGFEAEFADP